MDDLVKQLKVNTSVAVLARYLVVIVGTILVMSGKVSNDQWDGLVQGFGQIVGGVGTVATVGYALYKAWFKPQVPVKEVEAIDSTIIDAIKQRRNLKR